MSSLKKGDSVVIARKPKDSEPLNEIWDEGMDDYIGKTGTVVEITTEIDSYTGQPIECVHVQHADGDDFFYPSYCVNRRIVIQQVHCSCKTELLINRGCQCGAFAKEQKKK